MGCRRPPALLDLHERLVVLTHLLTLLTLAVLDMDARLRADDQQVRPADRADPLFNRAVLLPRRRLLARIKHSLPP